MCSGLLQWTPESVKTNADACIRWPNVSVPQRLGRQTHGRAFQCIHEADLSELRASSWMHWEDEMGVPCHIWDARDDVAQLIGVINIRWSVKCQET